MNNKILRFDSLFLRDFWRLLKPYWVSEEKRSAWALLLLNTLCIIAEVCASVGYNNFHRDFFNALQTFNHQAIIKALWHFLFNITLLTVAMSANVYFLGLLSLRWRRWLTHHYLTKWLGYAAQNHDALLTTKIDNPDQRVSEDLDQFPTATLSLIFGPYKLLHSILMLFSFGFILWHLSSQLIMGKTHFIIHGLLMWVALLYAILGTGIINWLGKKLAFLDYQQQQFNADFRFNLVELRGGNVEQPQTLFQSFAAVFKNTFEIIQLKTRLSFFSKNYNFISYLIGLAISIPFYLAKTITLGGVTQISSAYNSVVSGFSAFIDSFNELAEWRSVIHRLAEFEKAIKQPNTTISSLSYTESLQHQT